MRTLLFIIFFPALSYCQLTPDFETTIFVEDALGNKDSVIVGYAYGANPTYNPNYGEFDIESPFDSVLEVRAAHYSSFGSPTGPLALSKKIIAHTEFNIHPIYNCYYVREPLMVFFYAKHQPVTFIWNKNEFLNSYCRTHSMLSAHNLHLIVPDAWQNPEALELTSCMAEDSTFTTTIFDPFGFGMYRIEEIEGGGQDTAFGLLLSWLSQDAPFTPCTATFVVGAHETGEREVPAFFPNPTSGYLYMEKPEQASYEVWDISGKLVRHEEGYPIDMNGLPAGLYYLRLGDRVEKIVKQ